MPLKPERALLHPVWLLGLILLATNDHLLKGSELLPAALTGKLSDFAGLLIAPALFATLLRSQSRRALLAAHIVVGTVFVALQLSATAAGLWSQLFSTLGVGWRTWSDPTDLVALPMLALSWTLFLPAMQARPTTGSPRTRLTAQWVTACVGLVFSLATSPPEPDVRQGPDGWLPPISADVYLHNGTGEDLVLRISELEDDVMLDCFEVATQPARYLTPALFAPADTWTLPPNTNLPAWEGPRNRNCYAAYIEGNTITPQILFWSALDFTVHSVPGNTQADLGETLDLGAVEILNGNPITFRATQGLSIVFSPDDSIVEPIPGCVEQPDGERVAWSAPAPRGEFVLEAVDQSPDGCLGLDLRAQDTSLKRWFVCMPFNAWPFLPNDTLLISESTGASGTLSGFHEELIIERLTAAQNDGLSALTLTVSRGQGLTRFADATASLQPIASCPAQIDSSCGTVSQNARLLFGFDNGSETSLISGESGTVTRTDGSSLELFVIHAAYQPIVVLDCSEGPDSLGPDLELAVVQRIP